ncbi:MAG: hypothetical protein HY611_05315, partial [Elusimicrobia bacterium]|nr:hypothetical protein [Elusimicrobiota bacterium]
MRAAAAIIAGAGLFFFAHNASAFDIAVSSHALTEKAAPPVDADNVGFLENETALQGASSAGCGYAKQAFLQAEAPAPGIGGYEPFLYDMKKAAAAFGANVLVMGEAFTYQETKLVKYLTATAYRMECGGELLPGKFVEPSSTTWTLRGFKKTEEGESAPLAAPLQIPGEPPAATLPEVPVPDVPLPAAAAPPAPPGTRSTAEGAAAPLALPGMLPEPSPPRPQPASPPPQAAPTPQISNSMAAFYHDFIALD